MRKVDQPIEIEAGVTIYCDGNGARIEIDDAGACVRFLEIQLRPEQFTALLGRLASVDCKAQVRSLDKIGKVRISKPLIVEMPNGIGSDDEEIAARQARETACEGWTISAYFRSQDSFFTEGGKRYARTHQFKWVSPEEAREFSKIQHEE